MKIHHQHLKNTPLRLYSAEITNPNLVFTDFFQSFHLQDVREILWRWVTEVVSSPNSQATDHHERNNHLFFYEKIEALVEAAWIMNQRKNEAVEPSRQPSGKEARITDKKTDTGTKVATQPTEKETRKRQEKTVNSSQPSRFSKPARLIEKATTQPVEVITEVFDNATLSDLIDYLLPNWLRVALINTQSPYSYENGREMLYEFYEILVLFLEALWSLHDSSLNKSANLLTTDQMPFPNVITTFFQQFPIDYIRRELSDFLEAGIGHDGAYPNGFSPWQAWMAYNHVLCLIEASYQLYIKKQALAVVSREPEIVE